MMINEVNLSESCAFLEQEEQAETTDNYEHIVKQIDRKHRIIRCVDNIQYISQIRTGGKSERPWRSESYYMTEAGANRQSYPYREAALESVKLTCRKVSLSLSLFEELR